MIEAFEIGVSLALRDGVGEAIEKARLDVASVEAAVNAGGISVQRLRAAAIASIPPRSDNGSYDGLWPLLSQERRVGTDLHAETASPLDDPYRTQAAQIFETTPIPTQQFVLAMPSSCETAGFSAGGRAEDDSVGRPMTMPPASLPEQGPRYEIHVPANPAFKLWNAAAGYTEDPSQVSVPPKSVQSRDHIVTSTVLSEIGLTAAPEWQAPAASTAQMVVPEWATSSIAPIPVRQERSNVATTPISSDEGDQISNPPRLMEPAVATRAGSAQAADSSQGPTQGDVYLDDMLVGRWMSRFLNRAAGRAPVGPTAFDPRRSRILPGVTVGI